MVRRTTVPRLTSNSCEVVDGCRPAASPLCQPGQLTFLTRRLENEGITVACIQESRLSLPSDFTTTPFHIVHSPADRGIGGLLILVSKQPHIRVLRHKVFGQRVLSALVQVREKLIYVINCHAPIRKAPAAQHADFAQLLETAITSCPANAMLVGGSDLNARLAGAAEDYHVVGLLTSLCPHQAAHAQDLLQALQRTGTHLVNTFIDSGVSGPTVRADPLPDQADCWHNPRLTVEQHNSITTWFHAGSSKAFQIDYVLASREGLDCVSRCSTLPWGYIDLLTSSDHRPVVASFMIQGCKGITRSQQLRRHKTPQHLIDFKARAKLKLAAYTPSPQATPFEVTQELQNLALAALQETRPRGKQARASWIRPSTWTLMCALNATRKLLKTWKHAPEHCSRYLPLEVLTFEHTGATFDLPATVDLDSFSQAVVPELLCYVRALTKHTRSLLRADKRSWMNDQ
eukprot:6464371-Amphidinium_carterae.2